MVANDNDRAGISSRKKKKIESDIKLFLVFREKRIPNLMGSEDFFFFFDRHFNPVQSQMISFFPLKQRKTSCNSVTP